MPRPTTLLVIEPDENLRRAYASVLRFAGYRVDEASSGIAARERLQAQRPELVLMNVQLPTLEGALGLFRQFKGDTGSQTNTSWVALCRRDAALSGVHEAGFDAVLHTPVSYTELVGTASVFAGSEFAHDGSGL